MALVVAGLPGVEGEASVNLSRLFTSEVRFWSQRILRWSVEMEIDPDLIATVMQIESCGDPFARSRAGALGLFQVMPYHFAAGEDPYDPEINARRGLGYLKRALGRSGGDIRLALAGYNGGLGMISRPESSWPAETRRYVYWGSGIYADARRGSKESGRLLEWLQRGGDALCERAHGRLGTFIPRP